MSNANPFATTSTNTTRGYAGNAGKILLADLTPRRTDRAFLVGMTGSGKTTLARQLLSTRRYSVVLDYKGTLNWSEYTLIRSLKDLTKSPDERLLYRPTIFDAVDDENSAKLWEWIYHRGNCTVYNDETALTVAVNKYPFYYGATLRQGREKGLELWSATQRPLDIPSIIGSESEHVYAFRLRLPQDRKRVEEITGISAHDIAGLTKRNFLYAPQDGDVVGPLSLTFPQ